MSNVESEQERTERLKQAVSGFVADIRAKDAARKVMSGKGPAALAIGGGQQIDRVEVLTSPAKFHAAMILQATDADGSLNLSRSEIEDAIKYQAQRAKLGDLSFVFESLIGNMMQMSVSAAKMRTLAESTSNTDKAADYMQRAVRMQESAAKVACSVAGIARSGQSD